MDGVDVALLHTDGARVVRQGPSSFAPYDNADRILLREALRDALALADREQRPGVLAGAEEMITARHAEAVAVFLEKQQMSPDQIDVIGFHGQTVLHRPEQRLTVQIGDGEALAKQLGIPVACDFRAADVAAGGQGAPLVPVYHRALVEAAGLEGPIGLLNIGGVANLTFCAPGAEPLACDTGPGNALIDDLMLARTGVAVDLDGATAARGKVDNAALALLMDHPFFEKKLPKSLDRNSFSRAPVETLSTEDAAATLAAFTAEAVACVVMMLTVRPEKIIVCGGGARNPVILRELAARTRSSITTADQQGWSADAMEAQAFAYLAVRTLNGLPLTFPTTTGAPRPLTGGVVWGARPAS